jgi:hypothetical protein
MKTYLVLSLAVFALSACDTRVNVPPAEHKDTTIVNPPAKETEKKTETTTTTGPGGSTVEKKTETKQ